MTGTRWEWQDNGSSSGRMQRVASTGTYHRIQTAYRAYIDHATTCDDCGHGDKRCAEADQLWRAYRTART
ncbi:hypothetical protein [Streptomyces sp. 142MFCol3.1]|uniref:hypothetical protein n=1 Tax=Streptomyces sp. 142MFCol3.1 TaxID=1172179 RepID=UPI00040FDD9F|nr:hypothetical protein [Streptomyces sp. 142MFCol3.1]